MQERVRKLVVYVLAILLCIIFLLPFLIMITGSLQDKYFFMGAPSQWITQPLTLKNFKIILSRPHITRWFINSAVISIIPTITTVYIGALLGYVYAKKDFVGKTITFWLFLSMIMVPMQSYVIPRYVLFAKFNWINTYWAFLIPQAWDIVYFFLLKQYMVSIPDSLIESAKIDGASEMAIFHRIILPISKTSLAIVAVFTFISRWNDLFYPLLFTTNAKMFPMTVGLASLLTQGGKFSFEMAGTVINFIPTFVVFVFMRKYFVQGIATTGMKN